VKASISCVQSFNEKIKQFVFKKDVSPINFLWNFTEKKVRGVAFFSGSNFFLFEPRDMVFFL
jgi:hypothetical protein